MNFSEFVHRLFAVISAGSSTVVFTKSIIEAILTEEGQDIIAEYKDSSFKGFFNGNTSIARLAKKINAYIDPMNFEDYLGNFSDAAIQDLCNRFESELPDITLHNAPGKLSALFESILRKAAESGKKVSPKVSVSGKNTETNSGNQNVVMDNADVSPKSVMEGDGNLFDSVAPINGEDERDPFENYLTKAVDWYSQKKTLLFLEKPRPFYDIYVCNDVRYHKSRISGEHDQNPEITISNSTVQRLEAESKYIIIEGTGGIGKSMFFTHLFLSSANEYAATKKTPILASLKDYKDTTSGIVEFIWFSMREYDISVTQKQIITALENKKLILLLDGLDEIQSQMRESFDKDLEALIKSYPGNTVFITSRPIYEFVSYTRFYLFDIEPLNKKQAKELISKLDYWDPVAKRNFLVALDKQLYVSHKQFASNPLLLTIMLMTYSTFGEVPAKMHVFYSKAYETMARLHDATKGSYKRPLHTKMTPEEFSKYFAQFCARTYQAEVLEFDERTFSTYMDKVLEGTSAKENGVTARDFLLDLTDNLCLFYQEGYKYYFIHRSFQEYFTAIHFASVYDEKLNRVGKYFEKTMNRSYTDRTFDMLYDMIPEKVERYIFLPFLEDLLAKCSQTDPSEEYWTFLGTLYPKLIYQEGTTGEIYDNISTSFLYNFIIREKKLSPLVNLDKLKWPSQVHDLPKTEWVQVILAFMDENEDGEPIDDFPMDDTGQFLLVDVVERDKVEGSGLYTSASNRVGESDIAGTTYQIDTEELRMNPLKYAELRKFMERKKFPLVKQYARVKQYYGQLKERVRHESESEDLFDD